MTLHQFTIFAAIAKHKNFTRASEELHLTQPCISQQMRQLQEYYGAKLYERTARGVELTEAGWRFLSTVSQILEQVQKLKRSSADTGQALEAHHLRVGGTYATSALLLPSLLARFKKLHPDVEVDFRTNHCSDIENLLLRQKIEIGILPHPPTSDRIMAEPFGHQRLALVVSKRHPLARVRKLSLQQLAGASLLIRGAHGRDGTTAKRIISMLEQHGVKVTIGMRFEFPDALKEAVQRNLGVGLIVEDAVKYNLKCGEFKALKINGMKLERQSYVVYLHDRVLSTVASEFLQMVHSLSMRKRTELSASKIVASESSRVVRFKNAASRVGAA